MERLKKYHEGQEVVFSEEDELIVKADDPGKQVKFVRARLGRSFAVTQDGSVFMWGLGLKNEMLTHPVLILQDPLGVTDLRFNKREAMYL
jgi:hypothetical protein